MNNQKGSPRDSRRRRREAGQLILILILVMTVALSIGLSVVQKSLVDISTSSKVEQSSRAFSAAEAGIEKALRGDASTQSFADNNSRINQIQDSGLIPLTVATGTRQLALEFPPLGKEDVAQVWLGNPTSATNPPATAYNQTTLDVYWGTPSTDKAAVEITLIYYNGTNYLTRKWYLDNPSAARNPANGFDNQVLSVSCAGTFVSGTTTYQCRKTLGDSNGVNNGPLPNYPILLRIRLLYNTTSQPFAIQATGTCGVNCSLPSQARSIISTGASGDTERKVRLFQLDKVVPSYFDYAIFSAGPITK